MMKRIRWLSFAVVLATVGLSFVLPGNAQQASRVGLVVQFLDGSIEKRCVTVEGDEIHGLDVLEQSGLAIEVEYSGTIGAAVCKIESDGCPADNCFCQMPNYWSYWHLQEDQNGGWRWMYSQLGASSYVVAPGEVEGWRYGAGQFPDEMPLFDEICTPDTPTPTATGTFTPSPTLTPPGAGASDPTRTPRPTHTRAVDGQSPPEPTGQGTTIIIPGGATDTPTKSPTSVSSPVPAIQTPLISSTATVLATETPTVSPTQIVLPIETETPVVQPTAKEKRPAKKPTQTADGLPAKQAGLAPTTGTGTPAAQTAMPPASQQAALANETQPGAALRKVSLIIGGAASMLAFLALSGVLGIGLVLALVWKRR
jgi:hypothetical protein